MRRPLKVESFRKIRDLNIPIETIVDVGILTGTTELMHSFQDKKHILIEPIVEWNEGIRKSYSDLGIDFDLVNVAVSNANGRMNMETVTVLPGRPISHARLTSKPVGSSVREVDVRTLDSLLAERKVAKPYLLKIDVDGVELLILEGATATLNDTSVLVVEANIKNFMERANFLVRNGFELFDIVDPCYYDDRLRQVDLIFLNSKMVSERNLDMYKQEFDSKKWVHYR